MAWFNTVEFYVIAGTVAAAVVALMALPARRTDGVLHLVAGLLERRNDGGAEPAIDISVDDNRRVVITRRGLAGLTDGGAVSLAVNVAGFDVVIEERITYDRRGEAVDSAVFTLDFFAPERYKIRYNNEDLGLVTAFSLPVREGIKIHRELR